MEGAAAGQVGAGSTCQDEPRWQRGPEAVRELQDKAALELAWSDPPPHTHTPQTLPPPATVARGHVTASDPLPGATTGWMSTCLWSQKKKVLCVSGAIFHL